MAIAGEYNATKYGANNNTVLLSSEPLVITTVLYNDGTRLLPAEQSSSGVCVCELSKPNQHDTVLSAYRI